MPWQACARTLCERHLHFTATPIVLLMLRSRQICKVLKLDFFLSKPAYTRDLSQKKVFELFKYSVHKRLYSARLQATEEMHFKLEVIDVISIVLHNSLFNMWICEPSSSWTAEQAWLTAGSCIHIKLIGTEYGKQIFVEPTKSVTNSILLVQLQKVPPNDITSFCFKSPLQEAGWQ